MEFSQYLVEHLLFSTLFGITNLETGSNRKLVGDEEVLEWVFVLINEWEGFFIPISRERKHHPGILRIL